MKRLGFLLAATLLVAGCSRPAGPEQSAKPAAQEAAAPTLPPVWKSATTGKYYHVVVTPAEFQAEWVSVPEQFVKKGASIRSQARRQGTKYVGSSESYLPCAVGTSAKAKITNWCHVETGLEIDFVGPDRILGRGEALKKFDCAKCQAIEKEWKDFVWVPAETKPTHPGPAEAPAKKP